MDLEIHNTSLMLDVSQHYRPMGLNGHLIITTNKFNEKLHFDSGRVLNVFERAFICAMFGEGEITIPTFTS